MYIIIYIYMVTHTHNLMIISCSIESKHEVTILGGLNEFSVKFFGPAGSRSFCLCIIVCVCVCVCDDHWAIPFNDCTGVWMMLP